MILVIFTGVRSVIVEGKLQLKNDNLEDEILVKTTQVIRYKNDLGQEVTKTIEYRKTVKQLINSKDSMEYKLGVTIKASKMKEKQLKTALIASYRTEGGGNYTEEEKDDSNMIYPSNSAPQNQISTYFPKHFNDGYLRADIYKDSLSYIYSDDITVLSGSRMVDRKFILWKTIGWQKMIDRDMVEVTSSNPNAYSLIRKVRLTDPPRPKIKIGLGATVLVTHDIPKIYGVGKIGYKKFDYLGYIGTESYGLGIIYNF